MFDALATTPALLIASVFALSLLVGSFLNVVIHRLPIMLDREWRAQAREMLDDGREAAAMGPAGKTSTGPRASSTGARPASTDAPAGPAAFCGRAATASTATSVHCRLWRSSTEGARAGAVASACAHRNDHLAVPAPSLRPARLDAYSDGRRPLT